MLHERIKTATTVDHKNAERHSYGAEIMSGQLTRQEYTALLIANYMYIKPWEAQWKSLSAIMTSSINIEHRRKTTLLEDDLKAVGIDPASIQCLQLDLPVNLAQCLGRMYVIEGSTLGGAVIEKQLKRNPSLQDCTYNFYGGYGPALIPMWRAFLAELNVITEENAQLESIEWARKCFNDVESCFIQAKQIGVNS
ncbi:MAG: heme oxygenase [Bacteroidia bacterium]|jgi:heme oxygenase